MAQMRIAVYTDYAYKRSENALYADRAFALFLVGLAKRVESLSLVGRVLEGQGEGHYRIPEEVGVVALPHYESLAKPVGVLRSFGRAAARFWRALPEFDVVWVLGPHPLGVIFVALSLLRGKRVLLGVRQDLPQYARTRHPGRRSIALVADALEWIYRALGRRLPVVVVGPALADRYRHCPSLLEIAVSLVDFPPSRSPAKPRRYDAGELRLLSVGRLETEKNPLLLAEVLARLSEGPGPEWRLAICGEGPLRDALSKRLEEAGLADRFEISGYLPFEKLVDEYSASHFLLHTSWTEGLPQVFVEAVACGLPIVTTDVGGVRAALGKAVALVPPGDADAAASKLRALATDSQMREAQVDAGLEYARLHTMDAELQRLVRFLHSSGAAGNRL